MDLLERNLTRTGGCSVSKAQALHLLACCPMSGHCDPPQYGGERLERLDECEPRGAWKRCSSKPVTSHSASMPPGPCCCFCALASSVVALDCGMQVDTHSIPNPSNLRCLSRARRPADFKERCLEIQTGRCWIQRPKFKFLWTATYKSLPTSTYRRALGRVWNLHGYDHARDGKQRLR